MVPGNPCAPVSTTTRRIAASPSAMWGSNGWRPPGHSAVLLGSDGGSGRAAGVPGARVVHIARLAHPDVQLPARQDAHRELLDDASSSPSMVVLESPEAARHSSPQRG